MQHRRALQSMAMVAGILSGCASSQKKAEQALQTASSSTAAAALICNAWLQKTAPAAFVTDALNSTATDLDKLTSNLPADAHELLRQAQATARSAEAAVKHNNSSEVTRAVSEFNSAHAAFHRLLEETSR